MIRDLIAHPLMRCVPMSAEEIRAIPKPRRVGHWSTGPMAAQTRAKISATNRRKRR